jgi:hypothetical protein
MLLNVFFLVFPPARSQSSASRLPDSWTARKAFAF